MGKAPFVRPGRAATLWLLLAVPPVAAQGPVPSAPEGGLPRPGDQRLERPEFLEPRGPPPFELPAIPVPGDEGPLDAGPRFLLERVVVEGNTVFGDDELIALARPYVGRRIGTATLQRLRRELTLYYTERGYISSGAILPDQEVSDGTVRFRIVEGYLDAISVEGTERLPPAYVHQRLALAADTPLNVQDLQHSVQVLLDDPRIERIDARLGPGARRGESELEVQVREAPVAHVAARFENSRPPSVGALALRVDAELRSPFGFAERLFFSTEHTSGLQEHSAALELPLTPRDTRLFVRYRATESEVVEAPFDLIGIRSNAWDLSVAVSHPFLRGTGQELTLGLGLDLRNSRTFILDDVPFSFSAGPRRGESDVRALRFSQAWFDRRPDSVLALRSTFSFGLDVFGATRNPDPLPDGRFFAWLGQAQWAQRLGSSGVQAIVRADAQLTPHRLLPLEQFAIGGARTVRGYRESELVRDSGYAASLELRVPVWRSAVPLLDLRTLRVDLAPFLDFGQAWNRGRSATDLISAGVGLRVSGSERFFAGIYLAERFGNVPASREEDLQDEGVHFTVQSQLVW